MTGQDFVSMRRLMVSNQLRPNAIIDLAVIAAMETIARERFVPDDQIGVCYRDGIVRLDADRALNPPLVTARLLQAAEVGAGQRALVVGAATGYVPALLAAMGVTVTALEEAPALISRARLALDETGVAIVEGPLVEGWTAEAPYDLVYIDGAVGEIPSALIAQLADLGVLVGGLADHGITRQVEGRRVHGGFNVATLSDIEMATLPGFLPAPAFAF